MAKRTIRLGEGGGLRARVARCAFGAGLAALLGACSPDAPVRPFEAGRIRVYVGSGYVGTPLPQAVHVLALDSGSGRLAEIQRLESQPSPSFFALDPAGRFLYVNVEARPSAVASYAIDRTTGTLTQTGTLVSGGERAAYLSIDASGRSLLQANYEGHSVSVIAVGADGVPERVVDTAWQGAAAYPHSVRVDPSNRFAFVANRTQGTIAQYRFDAATRRLTPNDPFALVLPPRTGPRHLVFRPDGQVAWATCEASSRVATLVLDAGRGTLSLAGETSTLPADYTGPNNPADLRLHPSGRFLYATNRGHGSVAVFAVDAATGALTPRGYVRVAGSGPRNLAIDPAGRFLFVGVLDANVVETFRIDPESGALAQAAEPFALRAPSGLEVAELPAASSGP